MKIYYNKRKYQFKASSTKDGPPGYHDKDGQAITVHYKLSLDDVDEEVGNMYRISFDSGVMMDAFEDEVAAWKTKR